MEMVGERCIPIAREALWEFLNDVNALKECIPGCESIEQLSAFENLVTLVATVGPVKARFKGKMRLENLNPPASYRIVFEGAGGAAGFCKGEALVNLNETASDTTLCYAVKAQIGGKLAQLGSRLIDAAAQKITNDFFASVIQLVCAQSAAASASSVPTAADEPNSRRRWHLWWSIAALVAVGVMLVAWLIA